MLFRLGSQYTIEAGKLANFLFSGLLEEPFTIITQELLGP